MTIEKVHNVPARWLEELAEHYQHEADYFYREGEPELGSEFDKKADEILSHIENQGERNS